MSSNDLLTTTQAAQIAAVGASTIKRWADQGVLPFVRTVGGHRRFERSSVERMLREAKPTPDEPRVGADADPALGWRRVLERAQRFELDGRLLEARARLGRWCDVADEVAGGLRELGLAWERGELTIAEEHVASEKLARALTRVCDALPTWLDGPRVLLACATTDDHTLALLLAELCVREAGATPVWLGRKTPEDELIREVSAGDVHMLVLSASVVCDNADTLQHVAREVGAACRQSGAALVLGGSGAWPDTPSYGTRVGSFRQFHDVLTRELARTQKASL